MNAISAIAESWKKKWSSGIQARMRKMVKCMFSAVQLNGDELVDSSESLATRDYSASLSSSRAGHSRVGETETKEDTSNIEEAESSLRESEYLNYEEARALLGRLEYQKGNIEAALRVFEGIDFAALTPNIKASISRRCAINKRHSQSDAIPFMSMHAISLLVEAIFLKAKSLQQLGREGEAAQSCKVILDTFEAALPEGLPENFGADCKLQDTLNKTVELLPELYKISGPPEKTIISYRRALLYHWNLGTETKTRIEKEFAVFLLYSGCDACPPNLRSQKEGSFIPRNNLEEAILLLQILSRKISLGKMRWDQSVLDHLSFALSISGVLSSLAQNIEELLPGIMERNERNHTLALCYFGDRKDMVALNILKNSLNNREYPNCLMDLLLAAKICVENKDCTKEGLIYTRKLISKSNGTCLISVSHCLLGRLLSAQSISSSSDQDRVLKQRESLEALETSKRTMKEVDSNVIYHLSLENAEQRKLDAALYYAKLFLKLNMGASIKGWFLLARIFSAKKQFDDAETVIAAAIDQTGKWDCAELLRTKAKLQIAQGKLKKGIETYIRVLAIYRIHTKRFGVKETHLESRRIHDKNLEMETWHDLANVYTNLSQWRDAEACLSKSHAIGYHSASRCHSTGLLCETRGQDTEALKSYRAALDIDPTHVASLVSMAILLGKLDSQSLLVKRSFLNDALQLDRTNVSAWYNLGLTLKDDVGASAEEAIECFETAVFFQETAPVEPFR